MGRWLLVSLMMLAAPNRGVAQELDFLVSPGPLHQAHSDLLGLRNCTKCHSSSAGLAPEKCLDCHKDLADRVRAQTGLHAQKQDSCFECHHEHQGENIPLVRWDPSNFNHDETGYPLTGRHGQVANCEQCHNSKNSPPRQKTKTYLLNGSRCVTCHDDVHRGQLGEDCGRCHALDTKFPEVRFDHARSAFPLIGAHRTVDCGKCHLNKKWKGLRFSQCVDCHQDPHQPTLGNDCQRCHTPDNWKAGAFDHEQTRYPLRGMHRPIECTRCHEDKKFTAIAFERCDTCHLRDPHVGQFPDDCSRCHMVDGFKQTKFDHARSRYPLLGKHQSVKCDDCHRSEEAEFPDGFAEAVRYKPLGTECVLCHKDIHLGQLEDVCSRCHVVDGFKQTTFNHAETRYPLTGKHDVVKCGDCHRLETTAFPSGVAEAVRYKPLETLCDSCHKDIHFGQMEKTCSGCHTTAGFSTEFALFHHNEDSRFQLLGKHSDVICKECHQQEQGLFPSGEGTAIRYRPLPNKCLGCHRNVHDAGSWTSSEATLASDCQLCHTADTFVLDRFDHNRTEFRLTGRHSSLKCGQCHDFIRSQTDDFLLFRESSRDCADCHRTPHLKNLPRCEECHTSSNWSVRAW